MPRKQAEQRKLDNLSPADYEILNAGRLDPNYITDYYLRTPTSGTKWMKNPDPPNKKKSEGWATLYDYWAAAGKPDRLFDLFDIEYKIQWDIEGYPIFWHHHGWLWQDYQKDWFLAPQDERTVIGGVGSGKTAAIATSLVVRSLLVPGYRGFAVAPQMLQASEVYKYIMNNFRDTLWFQRFVWNFPQKPYPMFVIRNDYIGQATIEILSIEKDPAKVLTLEGDEVFLDQAEKIDELDDIVRNLGTRLRGQINGREKLGKLNLVANAGDNPQLWERFHMAEWEPEIYVSYNPGSWDNQYLSERDIANFKRRVGGSQQEIDQWMSGRQPMGKGEHFPAEMVKDNISPELDGIMDKAQKILADARDEIEVLGKKAPYKISDLPEYRFVQKSHRKYGVYHWEMPPDFDAKRNYIVIGDPGQGDVPDRNSGIIMTWDVSDFPQKPATMRAFNWISGGGSYWPFLTEYERTVKLFHAQGRNGFDSTGIQKGFDELVFAMMSLHAEGLNMAGNGKYLALNAAKMFMGKGLMQYPYISSLANQLTNYRLPDSKIKQDLVMCLCMSALYMRRYYWEGIEDETDASPVQIHHDRHYRPPKDRHRRISRSR